MEETTNNKRRGFVLGLGKALGVAGISSIAPNTFARGRSAKLKSVSVHKGTQGRETEFKAGYPKQKRFSCCFRYE